MQTQSHKPSSTHRFVRLALSVAAGLVCLAAHGQITPQTPSLVTDFQICSNSQDFNCVNSLAPGSGLSQAPDGDYQMLMSNGSQGSFTDLRPPNIFGYTEEYVDLLCGSSSSTNVCTPSGTPFVASDGNAYFTVTGGGNNESGVILRVTSSGTVQLFHQFCLSGGLACTDGANPASSPIQGTDGALYGTTAGGGATPLYSGGGIVYRIDLNGNFSILYDFCQLESCADGQTPAGPLVQASDGSFYGTTSSGGSGGQGTIYKISSAGFQSLYSFCQVVAGNGKCDDGSQPVTGLIEGDDGNLYGTTYYGGIYGRGNIFLYSLGGTFKSLDNFGCGAPPCSQPTTPTSALVEGFDGNLYGLTSGLTGAVSSSGKPVYQASMAYYLQPTIPAPKIEPYFNFCTGSGVSSSTCVAAVSGDPVIGSDGDIHGTDPTQSPGTAYVFHLTSQLAPAVTITADPTGATTGYPFTLYWNVPYAYSDTAHLCFASVVNVSALGGPATAAGAGNWSGIQTGTYSLQNHSWSGSASVTPTVAGVYTYQLECGGRVSNSVTVTVNDPTPTTTTVSATPNPVSVGATATLTATVALSSGGNPTGTVTFTAAGRTLGSAPLAKGSGSISASTAGVPPGTYTVTASYSGDGATAGASSGTTNVTVTGAATTATSLTVTPNPVTRPATAKCVITVKRTSGSAVPTGKVTLYAGTTVVATATLSNGAATITAPTQGIQAGTYPVSAQYGGDAADAASKSSTVEVVVK